ncbi:PREDICTED: uncharacterized protein LOC100636902 [Amphimedon queenslandica]|uniref:Uncharacterized protein n=1 Tax=Amphimedon queenslandica TaxID=400682 RepID=A0A1X7VL67_AMPQE|nr:PREDICTED: uncharacterized protein LOC100636902 [Amphimedon queenslandica]|eukprot:XP_019864232.1 PREDICTED: uncharacterized protein LOC100636902 [Amphimedon queenslandica]
MAKRSAVEQIVIEEKTVSDAIAKLIGAREKASAWHLKWAKFEECEFLIFLFGKLAELRWIWNEAYKSFFEKHQNDYLKTFKDIYYEERIIEDTKKALQNCEATVNKIRKQVESAQKKGDSVKKNSLDQELDSQLGMRDHLKKKIEGHDEKMKQYKIEQIQKGLLAQAQAGLQLADQMRHLFIAQLRIADILGTTSPASNNSATWQKITQVLIGLSDTLGLYPPPSGSVDPLPSPSESPHQGKKSTTDSPFSITSPAFSSSSSGNHTPTSRRSFPFSFRPLPTEPPPPPPPHSSHSHSHSHSHESDHSLTPQGPSPSHALKHSSPHPGNNFRSRAFTRSASDMTPSRVNKLGTSSTSNSQPPLGGGVSAFPHKASITIFEEHQQLMGGGGGGGGEYHHHPIDRTRSRSLGYPHSITTSSSASSSPYHTASSSPYHHNTNPNVLYDTEEPPSILNPSSGGESKGSSQELDSMHGSESDSGYADPIDALQQYYNSRPQAKSQAPVEPSYQSLAEIQRLRMAAVKLNMIEDNEDPTYSRPFDCLRGLPEPVRVSGGGETGTLGRRNYRRQYVPIATPESQASRHVISRGSSDEAISTSSESPEPSQTDEVHPLRRSDRTGSLDRLLESPEAPKVLVKVKDDFVTMRPRVNSDGNILTRNKNRSCRPDVLSPLALTSSTASEQDQTPPSSPHHSPLHVPVEVTKLQNGFAKLVNHNYSSSQVQ